MPKKKGIKPEHYFALCTGVMVKDIKELVHTLDYLSEGELKHHVNDQRNDFSTWIKDIFGEKKLARKLLAIDNKKDMQIALLKHLVHKKR